MMSYRDIIHIVNMRNRDIVTRSVKTGLTRSFCISRNINFECAMLV